MAKSKFSKRQVAGALLLSSTAVGTAASSSASAGNVLTDFLSGTKGKVGNSLNSAWEGTKGALGKVGKVAGEYVVSGVDKAGEVFKSGANKIGTWVKDSGVGNTLRNAKNSRIGQWVGNEVSKLGEKISQADTYKNYISGHEWGIAAIASTILTVIGIYKVYKAVQKRVNNYNNNEIKDHYGNQYKSENAINNFSKAVDDFVGLKLQISENINKSAIEDLSAKNPGKEIETQRKTLNNMIKTIEEDMESKDLSKYDFKNALSSLETLEQSRLYGENSKLKSAKNINELKEKFEKIKEAFCNVARAYEKLQPGCIDEELEHKLTIIEKKKEFKDKIDEAKNLLKDQSGEAQSKLIGELTLMKNKLYVKTGEAIRELNIKIFDFNFDKFVKDENLDNQKEVKKAVNDALDAGKKYCSACMGQDNAINNQTPFIVSTEYPQIGNAINNNGLPNGIKKRISNLYNLLNQKQGVTYSKSNLLKSLNMICLLLNNNNDNNRIKKAKEFVTKKFSFGEDVKENELNNYTNEKNAFEELIKEIKSYSDIYTKYRYIDIAVNGINNVRISDNIKQKISEVCELLEQEKETDTVKTLLESFNSYLYVVLYGNSGAIIKMLQAYTSIRDFLGKNSEFDGHNGLKEKFNGLLEVLNKDILDKIKKGTIKDSIPEL